MANYLREAGSLFPEKVIQPVGYLDVTEDIIEVVKQVKLYQEEGNLSAIQELLVQNPDLIKYMFGSKSINLIDEERYNLQVYAKNVQQQIFYQESNPVNVMSNGDVWIGGDI